MPSLHLHGCVSACACPSSALAHLRGLVRQHGARVHPGVRLCCCHMLSAVSAAHLHHRHVLGGLLARVSDVYRGAQRRTTHLSFPVSVVRIENVPWICCTTNTVAGAVVCLSLWRHTKKASIAEKQRRPATRLTSLSRRLLLMVCADRSTCVSEVLRSSSAVWYRLLASVTSEWVSVSVFTLQR